MADPRKELLRLWERTSETGRAHLLEYARYLSERMPAASEPPAQPNPIPPRPGETVVAALKRLSASYPMLDRARLLDETSVLMAQHTLEGRPREEVIAELEAVFVRHFERWHAERKRSGG